MGLTTNTSGNKKYVIFNVILILGLLILKKKIHLLCYINFRVEANIWLKQSHVIPEIASHKDT